MQHPTSFRYSGQRLYCDQVSLGEIAKTVGTPCYVYSRDRILANLDRLGSALKPIDPTLCYAVKANSNLSILRLLAESGSHFDIVSEGEFFRLQKVGVPPGRIIYSGVGKSLRELRMAVENSINCLVLESVGEARTAGEVARSMNKRLNVSLRVNPDVETPTHPYISTGLRQHKFGIDFDHVPEALSVLKNAPELRLVGIGSHIGSQILAPSPFLEAFRKIKTLAAQIENQGFELEHLDLGGGFGIPYRDEEPLRLDYLARDIAAERGKYRIVFEPGRYIVGDAGLLLTEVRLLKTNHQKNFVVVDAAMNDLIRPSLYGAHHDILPEKEAPGSSTGDIVGPVCETADFLAKDRVVPSLQPGDLLAVMNAGAYGFVAASNYNSRCRAAEVLVEGDTFRIIRRREDFEDLTRLEE